MSYEEIRSSFLQYYEKRLKLQLLRAELETIKAHAESLIVPEPNRTTDYSMGEFSLTVLETVIADTFTILADQQDLLALLGRIRSYCRAVDAKQRIFQGAVVDRAILGKDQMYKQHNDFVAVRCLIIMQMCSQALELLDKVLSS